MNGQRKMIKNKKGSGMDLIYIGIILLIAAMLTLFGYWFMDQFNDKISGLSIADTNTTDAMDQLEGNYTGVIDNSFLFLTVGLAVVMLILASLIRVHPMFLVLYILMYIVIVFVAGILSNMYQEMAANSLLTSYADNLVFTSLIMNYLPIIIGVYGAILGFVMYKLWSNAQ